MAKAELRGRPSAPRTERLPECTKAEPGPMDVVLYCRTTNSDLRPEGSSRLAALPCRLHRCSTTVESRSAIMLAHDRNPSERPSRYRLSESMSDFPWLERPLPTRSPPPRLRERSFLHSPEPPPTGTPPTRPPPPRLRERPFLPSPSPSLEPRALRLPPRPSSRKRHLVHSFAVLCLVNFLCALDGSILSVALPVRARKPPQVEQTLTWLAHHERPPRLGLRGLLGRDVFPPGVGGPAAAVGRAVRHRRSEEHSPGGAAAVHPGVRPGGG